MPGPVSDSYDPVWSTGANRDDVLSALREMDSKLSKLIGAPPRYILDVAREGNKGSAQTVHVFERELRLLRFAVRVALEEEDL